MRHKYLYIIIIMSVIPTFGIARRLQATETGPTAKSLLRDTKGEIIPSNPANLPYKLVSGNPEYVIGIDDLLEITTRKGDTEVVEKIPVGPEGKISFSFLYGIQASGLTPSELTRSLTQGMARYIRTPYVEVKVAEFRSKRVLVLGAISAVATTISGLRTGPGAYPLKGRTSALAEILDVGGAAAGARLNQVRLTRGGRAYILDLQQALTQGNRSQDIILEKEDILFLPGPGQGETQVLVFGAVTEPGIKLLDRPYLLDALIASKSFATDAVESRVHVIRPGKNPYNPQLFSVNVRRLYKGDFSQNIPLEDGDIVNVSHEALTDVNHFLSQLGPVFQALTLPATVVSAYTTAFGILPVLRAQNTLLGGGTIGIPTIPGGTTGTTGGTGGVTIPPGVSPKPAVPEDASEEKK